MEKKLVDQLKDGDPISVALRGGAGWVHGSIVWRREDVVLLKAAEGSVRPETPYVLVFLSDISALAVPEELTPPAPEVRQAGFGR